MPKARLQVFALTLMFLAFAIAPSFGQQAPDNDRDQSLETLKVNVNVVQLFFNVKDKHGALIPNLTKDDFDLFEDGKPQTIKYFTAESDLAADAWAS